MVSEVENWRNSLNDSTPGVTPDRLLREARQAIAGRRALAQYVPPDMMHGPARDLLVALYAAQANGDMTTLSALASEVGITPSVARRWIDAMAAIDLVMGPGNELLLTVYGVAMVEEGLRRIVMARNAF